MIKKKENKKRVIYIIGSLRNPNVPVVANKLRALNKNWEVFDSWVSPGPRADEHLRIYAKNKGLSYKETLQDYAATHIFQFDKKHLMRATDIVLVMPAGKSGHLELGFGLGKGKRGYVLFDKEPLRVDIMYQFSTNLYFDFNELAEELLKYDTKDIIMEKEANPKPFKACRPSETIDVIKASKSSKAIRES